MRKQVLIIVSIALASFLIGAMFTAMAAGESPWDAIWRALDEQQQQISELQSKLDSLNNTLTARIEALELSQSALAERIAALEDQLWPPGEVTLLDDRFDTGLDGWSYWGDSGYVLQWVSSASKISGDHVYPPVANCGMQKIVDISMWNETGALLLSFDWRATSDTSVSGCTNAALRIQDADSSSSLYFQALVWGGTTDTGWRTYVNDISSYVQGHSQIRIVLYLHDGWSANWQQTNFYDNIKLTSMSSP